MAAPVLSAGARPALHLVVPDAICTKNDRTRRTTAWGGTAKLTLRSELQSLGFAPRTVTLYLRTIRNAEAWCEARGTTLAKVSPELIARYAETRPRSWSSRKELKAALGHYWVIVKRRNPPLGVIRVPPKPVMVCKALEEDDARMLAKVARYTPYPKGLALSLGLYQGLRREEIATLPPGAFGKRLTVTGKGEKRRTIPLHPEVLDKLVAVDLTGPWVFPGRFGAHVAPATVWAWIKQLGAEAGLPHLTPHQLRHTCLATQNDNGKDLRAVQMFAGHSRPETTSGYTRTTEDAMMASLMSIDYLGERTRPQRPRRPAWPSLPFDGEGDQ
jgi:integrase